MHHAIGTTRIAVLTVLAEMFSWAYQHVYTCCALPERSTKLTFMMMMTDYQHIIYYTLTFWCGQIEVRFACQCSVFRWAQRLSYWSIHYTRSPTEPRKSVHWSPYTGRALSPNAASESVSETATLEWVSSSQLVNDSNGKQYTTCWLMYA